MDWVFDEYNEDGEKNPYWIDYCAMNAFAVKHNEKKGEFEDFRILENKSNQAYEAFNEQDPVDSEAYEKAYQDALKTALH